MKCTIKEINNLVEQIRSGKPPELSEDTREQHYHDPALPGFYIRVLDTGVATWTVQWKRFGLQKKIALGNVLVLDRSEAIQAGRKLLAKITLGMLDPHEARRERMRAAKVTFAPVVALFLERRKLDGDARPNTLKGWRVFVDGYYLRPLHNVPIDEITRDQLQTQIDHIAIRSGKKAAYNCYSFISTIFKWAIKTGKLPEGHHNPMANVQIPSKNPPRKRVLTNDEIRLIWKICEAWEAEILRDQQMRASTGGKGFLRGPLGLPDHSQVVRLLFLTGCRAQEIANLQQSEVDFDNKELQISAERMKNAEILCNPLSDWAVQILRSVKPRTDGKIFGYGSGHFNVSHLTGQINIRIAKSGGTPPQDWTIHDIRRTFRTHLSALGVTKDVAEALLSHLGHRTELERTYDLYEHWPEKLQALEMWEANLRAIIDGTAEKIARPRFGERQKKGGTA
jgi:integrase